MVHAVMVTALLIFANQLFIQLTHVYFMHYEIGSNGHCTARYAVSSLQLWSLHYENEICSDGPCTMKYAFVIMHL